MCQGWERICAKKVLLLWVVYCLLVVAGHGRSGGEVQALLDAGKDVALEPGEVVELAATLEVKRTGTKIYTTGATSASDFATIRHMDGAVGMLINAHGVAGVVLEDLILDGNRPGFRHPEGKLEYEPMLSLGGVGADGQVVRRCIVVNSRSAGGWGAIHAQEGADGIVIEDNIVFACGADIRGNGRSPWEKPFGWGDGISTASRNTLIRNNLIVDSTDEGIMVQGGPGTKVQNNLIIALSREMLGGIALIDPFGYFQIEPKESKRFDYRGVVVEDNRIIAMGSRIHAALPMGGDAWHPTLGETTLVGAIVRNNLILGRGCGYGYVANGIDEFIIEGNRSEAVYSGLGDGLLNNPPDEPSAYLFNPDTIGTSKLQPEFRKAQRHVSKVLRTDRGPNIPRDALGYRDLGYPEQEANAIVEGAYVEMLGRLPDAEETNKFSTWLQATHANADALRIQLMATPEFVERNGPVNPLDLHKWRGERMTKVFVSTCMQLQQRNNGQWPDVEKFYEQLKPFLEFKE